MRLSQGDQDDEALRQECSEPMLPLVVKVSASGAEDPGFESRLRRDFSGAESYQ